MLFIALPCSSILWLFFLSYTYIVLFLECVYLLKGSVIFCILILNLSSNSTLLYKYPLNYFINFIFLKIHLSVSFDLFSCILGILLVFFIVCYPRPFLSHYVHHPRDSFCFFIVLDPLLPDIVLCWVLLWWSTFSSSILSIWRLLLI